MSLQRHHRTRQSRDHGVVNREHERAIQDQIRRMRNTPVSSRTLDKREDLSSVTVETRGVMFERASFSAWTVMGARVIR